MLARVSTLTLGWVCPYNLGFAGELAPGHELQKRATLTQPDYLHRLIVKFGDGLRVRRAEQAVISLTGAELSDVQAIESRREGLRRFKVQERFRSAKSAEEILDADANAK